MRTLLMEHRPEGTAIALMEDRLLTDHRLVPDTGLRTETVMIGRVRQNVRGMGAVFVSLPGDQVGFLPESEGRAPLHPGDFVLVQVKKPPTERKYASLTQDISLAGQGLILLPLSGTAGVSARVSDETERARLQALAQALRPQGMGLVMRRRSLALSEDALRAELEALMGLWTQIRARAGEMNALTTLWQGRSAAEQALDDFGAVDRVILDREENLPVPAEQSPHPFADYAVEEQRERLLRRQIWLPSGGFLVVDPCEALTAVDVNTGKDVGKRNADKEQLFLNTNLEAAEMIARVLRVRGVGGIIIVDLIDMEEEASRQRVLERFRALADEDPVKCVIHGFTSLGLLEMTRKKTGR